MKRTNPMEVSVLHDIEIKPGQTDTVYLVNHKRDYQDGSEIEGNLALFNAAPELLNALKQARHRLQKMQSEGYPQDKTLPLVEAAIAKAEGNKK